MSFLEAERCEEVVASIDRISSLPNDLLIQILSLVSTKDAVATMFLSKRWRFVWTLVPKIEYKDTGVECKSVWNFLDKLLELHKAPVLEHLCIQLGEEGSVDVDVGKLVANAVDRFVSKLELEGDLWIAEPTRLPDSLYTCNTLVELTLSNKILVDVPSSACLPSLKILHLMYVVFKDEDSLKRLVSSCSVLAQSIACLTITDDWVYKRMNKSRSDKPHIDVVCNYIEDKYLGAISLFTSLVLTLKDPMSLRALMNFSGVSGITFSRLRRFVICPRGWFWLNDLNLLPQILKNSPILSFLCITSVNGYLAGIVPFSWYQPSFVPECLSYRLEEFKWIGYTGNEEEKLLMEYILENSKCLKKVTIILADTFTFEEKEMVKTELKSIPRVSTTSKLFIFFNEMYYTYLVENHIYLNDHIQFDLDIVF